MSDRATIQRRSTKVLAAGQLALALAFPGGKAWAHAEGPAAVEGYLVGLTEGGAITAAQHERIELLSERSLRHLRRENTRGVASRPVGRPAAMGR